MPYTIRQVDNQEVWIPRRPNRAELMSATHAAARRHCDNRQQTQPKYSLRRSASSLGVRSMNNSQTASSATCQFETTFVNKKRRFSFYDPERPLLTNPDLASFVKLDIDIEATLEVEILDTQQRLLPGFNDIIRKEKFLVKLESLLNERWSGREFVVHAFGSTENKLGTRWSDVGMQRVECRSQAKVPVVSIYDPELDITCDMNINNTLALRNTKLVRTYMQIDERAQILAYIIKHWAKMRALNDAGRLKGAILTDRITRDPPVLPCLHAWPHERKPMINGIDASFADDVEKYGLIGYGRGNSESIASLLFGFFHYYSYVYNYEQDVASVRSGHCLPKYMKNYPNDNIFAIEEPFTTSRNLGNTADMGSFRGIHEELRRSHALLAMQHRLGKVCERYEPEIVPTRNVNSGIVLRLTHSSSSTQPHDIKSRVVSSDDTMVGLRPTMLTRPVPTTGLYTTDVVSQDDQKYHLSGACASEHLQYLNLAIYPRPGPYTTLGHRIRSRAIVPLQTLKAASNQPSSEEFLSTAQNIIHNESSVLSSRSDDACEKVASTCDVMLATRTDKPSSLDRINQTRTNRRSYANVCRSVPIVSHSRSPSTENVLHDYFSSLADYQLDISYSDLDESQASCSLTLASSRSSPISAAAYPLPETCSASKEHSHSDTWKAPHAAECTQTVIISEVAQLTDTISEYSYDCHEIASGKETYASKVSRSLTTDTISCSTSTTSTTACENV